MSLINQMLKDLEDRRQKETVSRRDEALQDLPTVAGNPPATRRGLRLAVAALVVLGLFGGGIGLWQSRSHHSSVAPPARPIPPRKVAAKPLVPVSMVKPELKAKRTKEEARTSPSVPPSLEKTVTGRGAPSGKSAAGVASAGGGHPKAQAEASPSGRRAAPEKAAAAHPRPPAATKARRASPVSGPLPAGSPLTKIAAAAASPTKQSSPTAKRPGARNAGGLAKTPHAVSPQEEAQAAYRRGTEDLRQRRYRSAEADLQEALAADKGHLKARETLVNLLLRSGRVSEAAALLAEGVTVAPGYLPFRTGYARILVGEGDLAEAKAVLLKGDRPKLAADPGFFALLAAISQRSGDYPGAAAIYRKLINRRPEAGIWWMGLGIALESEGDKTPAVEAYRKALTCDDLNADLRRFVASRASAIKGPGPAEK